MMVEAMFALVSSVVKTFPESIRQLVANKFAIELRDRYGPDFDIRKFLDDCY